MPAIDRPGGAAARYRWWLAALLWLILTGTSSTATRYPALAILPSWAALAFATLALLFLGLASGETLKGSAIGLFVNSRNVISVSRAQLAIWTLLGFGALLAIIAIRAGHGLHPLDIAIPPELLQAMGISAATAAAAPAILSLKTGATSNSSRSSIVARRDPALRRLGNLIARPWGEAPLLEDLVMGDEVANAGEIDLSKVQQIILTLLLPLAYFLDLGQLFQSPALLGSITRLPPFSASFVNLMLVSHGGYLAYKVAAKPGSAPASPVADDAGLPRGPADAAGPAPLPPAATPLPPAATPPPPDPSSEGVALPGAPPAAAGQDHYREPIPRPSQQGVNQGLTSASSSFMIDLLGLPRSQMTGDCQAVDNAALERLVATRQVGPVHVTGLKIALDSLEQIFADVRNEVPELYARIGTAGMMCCRFKTIRGVVVRDPSNHSWGTAIDLTVGGGLDSRDDDLVQRGLSVLSRYFNGHGWYWGSQFPTQDGRHFEVSQEQLVKWRIDGLV